MLVGLLGSGTAACRRDAGRLASADGPAPAADLAPATEQRDAGTDAGARPAEAALRLLIEADPGHLNPDLDPDRWAFRLAYDAIYEPLMRAAPGVSPLAGVDEKGYVPVLAERFSVEDGGRRLVFHLRPGLRFHDDHPLTVVDVQFTLDRLRARRTYAPRVQAELADIERVEIIGRDGIRVWAARPSAFLLAGLSEIGILPEHVFGRGELMYQSANRRPVGSGPYRLRTWERGRRLVLERWDGYWGERPAFAAIDVTIDDDAARALGKAKRGDVDVLGRLPPAYLPEQVESPTIRAAYEVVRVRPARFAFVVWNVARAPLGDPAVRRALSLAVDRTRLVAQARHGLGRPIAVPPLGGLDESEAPAPRHDPTEAAAALDAAGLTRAGQGPRQSAGRPWRLVLLVPTGSREAEETGRRLVESLGKLGIAVDVASGDLGAITQRLKRGAFDGALLEWTGRPDDDLAPIFRSGGTHNFGGYLDREVDALLDALHRPAPPAERRALYVRLAQALAQDPPALFLYAPEEAFLYSRRLAPPVRFGDFLLLRALRPAP